MAEGAGFEPARRFITVYTLSRHAPSTARPPLLPAGPHYPSRPGGAINPGQITASRASSCISPAANLAERAVRKHTALAERSVGHDRDAALAAPRHQVPFRTAAGQVVEH